MTRWRWLEAADLIAMHREVIAEFGGRPGLRDQALLESAAARPKHLAAYGPASAFDLAAAYAFGLARNHPFIDGNKRIGFLAMVTFLGVNGYDFSATDAEVVDEIMALAAGTVSEAALTDWVREHVTVVRD